MGQDVIASPYASLQTANKEDLTALAFSGDGKSLAVGDDDGKISVWDVGNRRSVTAFEMRSEVKFLSFLSGDKDLIAVDKKGQVTVFNLLKGATGTSFQTKARPVNITIDAGKQLLAIANSDQQIELYDLKAAMPVGLIEGGDQIEDALFLGFDRPGQQLVAIAKNGTVVGWNPVTLKKIREVTLQAGELHGSRSVVHSAATNRSANVFVVGIEEVALPKGGMRSGANPNDLMRQNFMIAYDWNSGIEVKRVKIPAAIDRMVMGPGNDHIAGLPDEGNDITLVDLRKGEVGGTVAAPERPLVLAISEDNSCLALGLKEGAFSIWKLQYRGDSNVRTATLPSLAGRVRSNSGTEPALKPGVPVRLAILSFEAKGVSQEIADLCLNSLSNSLSNFDYITLVERKQIAEVLKEQQFQSSFMADEATSAKMGKLVNADHVLMCSVGKLGTTMLFTARLLNVETGKVVKGREVICEECRDQDIFDAIKMLASTIAQ
jgi:hypothetical protein